MNFLIRAISSARIILLPTVIQWNKCGILYSYADRRYLRKSIASPRFVWSIIQWVIYIPGYRSEIAQLAERLSTKIKFLSFKRLNHVNQHAKMLSKPRIEGKVSRPISGSITFSHVGLRNSTFSLWDFSNDTIILLRVPMHKP